MLRVQHEDVVDDLEASVRRMLDFCGLPFEPQCVDFHKTQRSVRTASSEQVRQPIFRDGLDQWKHFEPWLEPLRHALGDALSDYRDLESGMKTGRNDPCPCGSGRKLSTAAARRSSGRRPYPGRSAAPSAQRDRRPRPTRPTGATRRGGATGRRTAHE